MREYRVIEKRNKYYPEYKNGWKTFWCWISLTRPAYEQYPKETFANFRVIDAAYQEVRSFYKTFDEAKDACDKDKEKREIKIIKI
jgi:hypothetical protein